MKKTLLTLVLSAAGFFLYFPAANAALPISYPQLYGTDGAFTSNSWGLHGSSNNYAVEYDGNYSATGTICQVGLAIGRGFDATTTNDLLTLQVWYVTSSTPNGNMATAPNLPLGIPVSIRADSIDQLQTPQASNAVWNLPICLPTQFGTRYTFVVHPSTTSTQSNRFRLSLPQFSQGIVNSGFNTNSDQTLNWTFTTNHLAVLNLYGGTSTGFIVTIPTLPVSSSSITLICPDFGIFTPLCDGVLWFLVPNPTTVSTIFGGVYDTLNTKFPFSYLAGLSSALESASIATSTAPLLSIDLSSTVSSSTGFGNFMPSTVTMFSASTVREYAPDGAWNTMRTLLTLATYFGLVEMIYFGGLYLLKKET